MRRVIPPLPQYIFMAWYLVKHRDNFTFYLLPRLLSLGICKFIHVSAHQLLFHASVVDLELPPSTGKATFNFYQSHDDTQTVSKAIQLLRTDTPDYPQSYLFTRKKVNLSLSFTTHHATQTYLGSGGTAPRILTLALDGGELSVSQPDRFTPGTPWTGGPQSRSRRGGEEKIISSMSVLGTEPLSSSP
jgi:hypothetical protein